MGNSCYDNDNGDGINVTGDATTNSDYNSLTGNTCTGNGDDGIAIEGTTDANQNIVVANNLYNNSGTDLVDNGTSSLIRDNKGYVTENSGTSSIDSGQTTKVVAHGLATTPTVVNIAFREQGTDDFGRWWVDTIGASNFTLNVSVDPGVSNLDFAWEAKVR